MNYDYIHNYSEDEFEDIQSHFDGKAEYDNGLIFLSSTPSIKHNEIKRNILTELSMFLKGSKCKVYDEQIEVIFNSKDDVRKYKPDIFVMCEDASKKGESFTTAPKIVFEVISKSTASHDRITKLQIYRKYGVMEYNMIEQDGTFIQCTLIEDEYHVKEYSKDDTYISSVFPDFKIKLSDIF